MKKLNIGVIFGGISTEHEVSIVSGTAVIENLNKEKYNIIPIYIDRTGKWYKYRKNINQIKILKINEDIKNEIEEIINIEEILRKLDVAFPVLHGVGGEDGSIQGLFKMFGTKYIGCGILASSIGMDKVYSKIIFEKANIKQAKYEYIRKCSAKYIYINDKFEEKILDLDEIIRILTNKLNFPMFIKPSNSGSSVGINKALNRHELKSAIEYASKFDNKILIEEELKGKEVECAVLGNEEVIVSNIGEIITTSNFYTYNAKYNNSNESRIIIPADLPKDIEEKIKNAAIKAFKAIDGKGMSRVDFFADTENNEIYINEINTLPGFTAISMYPKLFESVGIKYSNLLDRLIKLAIEG